MGQGTATGSFTGETELIGHGSYSMPPRTQESGCILCVPPVQPQGPGSRVLKADVKCRSKHLASQPVGAVSLPLPHGNGGLWRWASLEGLRLEVIGEFFQENHLWQKALKSPLSMCSSTLPPSPPLPGSPSILPVDSSTGSSL